MKRLIRYAATRWQTLAARERRALVFGAAVLGPLLLVFGLALPLSDQLARLERRGAVLTHQLAELRAMHAWLQANAAPVPAADGVAAAAARLDAELVALPGFQGSVRLAGDGVDVLIEAAPFDPLLLWLDGVQRRERLFPAEVRLAARPEAGRVGGRVRLLREAP